MLIEPGSDHRPPRLMLLDGNGLIYRGYFALPPLTTSKGELVNAVFGFCEHRPPRVPGHQARLRRRCLRPRRSDVPPRAIRGVQGDPPAHARRPARPVPQGARIVGRLAASPSTSMAGYEADDVIGTLIVEAEQPGLDTTIVTGDLDMLQLVTRQTRLMTTRMGVQSTIIYDPTRIHERYGLRPDQMIDYKASRAIRPTTSRAWRGGREDRRQAHRPVRRRSTRSSSRSTR